MMMTGLYLEMLSRVMSLGLIIISVGKVLTSVCCGKELENVIWLRGEMIEAFHGSYSYCDI
mgnify:FL=1